jgi:hypothetical protein
MLIEAVIGVISDFSEALCQQTKNVPANSSAPNGHARCAHLQFRKGPGIFFS